MTMKILVKSLCAGALLLAFNAGANAQNASENTAKKEVKGISTTTKVEVKTEPVKSKNAPTTKYSEPRFARSQKVVLKRTPPQPAQAQPAKKEEDK